MTGKHQRKFKLKNVMTVDVGNTTALAYWNGNLNPETEHYVLSTVFGDHCTRGNIIAWMGKMFEQYITWYKPERVLIEGVKVYNSVKGDACKNSGDIIHLSYLVGSYATIAMFNKCKVEIITAPQWKGTMSKEATKTRVELITGLTYKNEHIYDAVGIGLAQDKDLWTLKNINVYA